MNHTQSEVETAIIPCAGLGTRLLELGEGTAKELVPVGGKPMVQHAVEEALAAGITRIVVVIRPGKEEVVEYLGSPEALAAFARYPVPGLIEAAFQDEPSGLADAVRAGWPPASDGPVALLLPDNIYRGNAVLEMIPAFSAYRLCTTGLLCVERRDWPTFGNCGGVTTKPSNGSLTIETIEEKGEGHFEGPPDADRALRWFGRSILTGQFLDELDEIDFDPHGERDDVPVFQSLIRTEGVVGVPLECGGFDVGTVPGYRRAEQWFEEHGRRGGSNTT